MVVYIIELDSIDEINESTARILLSIDDPELCSVYIAESSMARQIAKAIIPKYKQEEIERYASIMFNQHRRFNKNYLVFKAEKNITKHQIIKHVINKTDIKDCLIKF